MGDDQLRLICRQVEGQEDFRPEQPQHKGRGNRLALIEVFPQQYRRGGLAPQVNIAPQGIGGHGGHPQKPEGGEHGQEDLQRVGALPHGRLQAGLQHRIDQRVDRADSAVDGRRRRLGNIQGDGLGSGQEAHGALPGKGHQEPQSHQSPQPWPHALRRPAQEDPQHQHRQNEPSGVDAVVCQSQKQLSHGHAPPGSGRSYPAPGQSRLEKAPGAG